MGNEGRAQDAGRHVARGVLSRRPHVRDLGDRWPHALGRRYWSKERELESRRRPVCSGGHVLAGWPDFASLRSAYPGPITVDLIDVETGRTKVSLATQHTRTYALKFIDDGRGLRAYLGDMDGLKQDVTWDVATGKETGSRVLTCRTS